MTRMGYYDKTNPRMVYLFPKKKKGTAYYEEFFDETNNLGNIGIVKIKGKKIKTIKSRGY